MGRIEYEKPSWDPRSSNMILHRWFEKTAPRFNSVEESPPNQTFERGASLSVSFFYGFDDLFKFIVIQWNDTDKQ